MPVPGIRAGVHEPVPSGAGCLQLIETDIDLQIRRRVALVRGVLGMRVRLQRTYESHELPNLVWLHADVSRHRGPTNAILDDTVHSPVARAMLERATHERGRNSATGAVRRVTGSAFGAECSAASSDVCARGTRIADHGVRISHLDQRRETVRRTRRKQRQKLVPGDVRDSAGRVEPQQLRSPAQRRNAGDSGDRESEEARECQQESTHAVSPLFS